MIKCSGERDTMRRVEEAIEIAGRIAVGFIALLLMLIASAVVGKLFGYGIVVLIYGIIFLVVMCFDDGYSA